MAGLRRTVASLSPSLWVVPHLAPAMLFWNAKISKDGEKVDSVLLGLIIVIGLSAYFLPFIVAQIRSTKRRGITLAVNLIFGWTVVGWIAALIWAMGQQPSPEGETARSCVVDSDIWFFDPPNLTKQSAIEQGDGWVLGLDRFLESPRHR